MIDNNKENRMSIDDFDFAHEDATDDTSMFVNYLVTRLHQAMGNPSLQGEVQQQLYAYGILPPPQQERDPERFHGETSKRGLSTVREVENPYQELKKLLEGKPSSKKKGHAQHEGSPSKEREGSESQDESMEDVAPRRRRDQRSLTPTKWKRSPHSPHRRESKREEKSSRKKKERKRSPSSPSSSPSSSSNKGSGYSSQEKQRRGHQRRETTCQGHGVLVGLIDHLLGVGGRCGRSHRAQPPAAHDRRVVQVQHALYEADGRAVGVDLGGAALQAEVALCMPAWFFPSVQWLGRKGKLYDLTSFRTSLGYTPYHLVFGKEAILPIEVQLASLKILATKNEGTPSDRLKQRILDLERLELDREMAIEHYATQVELDREMAIEHYATQAERRRQKFNEGLKDKELKRGMLVLCYDNRFDTRKDKKFMPRWEGPYVIRKKYTNGSYRLQDISGKVHKTRVNGWRLKPYFQRFDAEVVVNLPLEISEEEEEKEASSSQQLCKGGAKAAVEFAKNKEWKAQHLNQLGFKIEPNIEVKVVEQPRILTKEPGHDQHVALDVDTFRKEMQKVVGLMKNLSVHMIGGGRGQGYGYGRGYGSNEGFAGGRGRGMAGRGYMFQFYNCGEWGHKSPQCDKPKRMGGDMFSLPSQIPSRAQDYGIEIKGEAGPSGLTAEEKGKTKVVNIIQLDKGKDDINAMVMTVGKRTTREQETSDAGPSHKRGKQAETADDKRLSCGQEPVSSNRN
ncbi:hypothetical protein L7F22_034654 [Adiantum nelumboides]|nr:hypothetical protein [Adiantum nelumboides]